MLLSSVRYIIDETGAGWRVLDLSVHRVALFGALRLEGLTRDEAGIMLGLIEAVDRANGVAPAQAFPVEQPAPAEAPPPDQVRDEVTTRLETLADLARQLLAHPAPVPSQ